MSDRCNLAGEMIFGQTIREATQKIEYLYKRQKLHEHISEKLYLYLNSPDSMNLSDGDREFLNGLLKNT